MRSSKTTLRMVLAMAALMAGADALAQAAPRRRGNGYQPTPPRVSSARDREIADHNAKVEARRAERKAAKMARRAANRSGAA